MKKLIITLLTLLLCLATPLAYSASGGRISLWGATTHGMSLTETLAAVPGARHLTTDAKPPFSEQGTQALALLENLTIADRKFNVWFVFRDHKLAQVTLHHATNATDDLPQDHLSTIYVRYTELLSLKYGKPISTIRQEFGPPISAWYAQWVYGTTNIDLNVDKTRISITYGTQFADDLSQL